MTISTRVSRRREPNPVLIKELRSRFRGPRSFAALTVFLLTLAGFAFLFYLLRVSTAGNYYGMQPGPDLASEIGQTIFAAIAVLEMVLMAFIGPALTMSAISGESERQTYELLLATPLSGWSILRGKVGAALAYVLLLIFAAIPVMSLAFLFGGVTASAVLQVQLSVFVGGLLFVMVGMFCSSFFKRTVRAAITSYLLVGLLCLAPAFLMYVVAIFTGFFWGGTGSGSEWWFTAMLELSPFASLLAVVTSLGGDMTVFWAQSMVLQLIFSSVLFLLAATRIRRVGREAAVGLLVVVLVLWGWVAWVMAFPVGP